MIRVPVRPELLRWARHRAGLGRSEFPARFKKLPEWETGRLQPTLRLADIEREIRPREPLDEAKERLSRHFQVSTLVVLRRLLDLGWIDRERFDASWGREVARHEPARPSGGGDFCRTAFSRASKPFARAVIADTLEGRTQYTDAFRMLGVRNPATLDRMAGELGLTP